MVPQILNGYRLRRLFVISRSLLARPRIRFYGGLFLSVAFWVCVADPVFSQASTSTDCLVDPLLCPSPSPSPSVPSEVVFKLSASNQFLIAKLSSTALFHTACGIITKLLL